jgi:NCAIR mutase (PurE)-related protein
MADPVSDETARNRWLVIVFARLAGVAMVVVGLLGTQGVVAMPMAAAYALLAVGLADVFLVPTLLARKWRSPDR